MRKISLEILAIAVLTTASSVEFVLAGDPSLEWIRQFGSSGRDVSFDVSADGVGNVYVVGQEVGRSADVFLRKYDSAGTLDWRRRLGTSVTTGARVYRLTSWEVYTSREQRKGGW